MEKHKIKKIKQLRYKFYIFVLILIAVVVYPYFQDFRQQVDDLKLQVENLKSKVHQKEVYLNRLKQIEKEVEYMEKNKKEIVNCINNKNCDVSIKDKDLLLAKSYFMFSEFKRDKKMDFNQKEVLSDIVTFLQKTRWTINVISFSDVKRLPKLKDIYSVDITLNADFPSYNNFKRFLDNVENKVYLNAINNLYYIKNLSYNILQYNKPQTVTINMSVYFYK